MNISRSLILGAGLALALAWRRIFAWSMVALYDSRADAWAILALCGSFGATEWTTGMEARTGCDVCSEADRLMLGVAGELNSEL